MPCILHPECNFLHGYFRCWLPVEVVDVEMKITSMQGTHIFRRDRMTQLIKCTLWSMRLCPYPTIVKKMKTFLEVEGKMGPIPQSTSSHIGPLSWTLTPMSGKRRPQRRGKEQHLPKDLGLTQSPSLVKQLHTHPWQFPRPQPISNVKCQKEQIIDPHP